MTRQESFKKRVRARMATTGERYTTARRALLATADRDGPGSSTRTWISMPEISDDAVREGSGQGWDHWCDLIDGWAIDPWDHAAAAARLEAEQPVNGWWAQTITVGYERITGRRLPHQMADGTFTANKSRTVAADADKLRELLLDADHRRDLFPGEATELRSSPTAKAIRLVIGPGVATISVNPKPDGRTNVTVQHQKLPTFDDVERWKFWWSDWLEAVDQG